MRDTFSFGEIRRRIVDEIETNRDVIESLFADYDTRTGSQRPGEVWFSIKVTLDRGYLKSSFQYGEGRRILGTRHFNQNSAAAPPSKA
jgi:hypothetical protein